MPTEASVFWDAENKNGANRCGSRHFFLRTGQVRHRAVSTGSIARMLVWT